MKQVRKISLYLFLISLLFACENKEEIEVNTLALVYVDLLVVEDFYNESDSLEIKREEVFSKYSVSEELYDSTFKHFSYDREKWDSFFKLANSYLDTLKAEFTKPAKTRESIEQF